MRSLSSPSAQLSSAQLSSAGQSLPLLRGGLRGVAASDGTGDQSDL